MNIIINTFAFMISWNGNPTILDDIMKIVNRVFLGIFTGEAIMKIIVYKIYYFKDSWNIFDFVVVILTLGGVGLEVANIFGNIGTVTSVLRTFRIARVLRLVRRAKSLRIMFTTFIVALPALANIGCLLFLVVFLYSVLGTNLFTFVE